MSDTCNVFLFMVRLKYMKKNIQGWDALHPKQQQLYEILLKQKGDESLTLDEMRSELGTKSINTVVHHLKQLEKKGYIRKYGEYSKIEVLPAPVRDIMYLNLYGLVKCGPDGFFNEDNVIDRIPFPAKRLRVNADSFLVEAHGNSMAPMIHDRDLVLIDKMPVDNGDTAVVVYNEGAILKRIFKENNHIVLQSLNPAYEPIVAKPSEVNLVGIVRGVVRSFGNDDLKAKKNRQ